jgi:hypothetical protein
MRKKRETVVTEMPKPKYQIGEVVDYKFLGSLSKGKIINLRKNPGANHRWIYDLEDLNTGRKIPYVGVHDTEEFANIVIE